MAVPTNVLSLCAGGGGLDLGVRAAVPDARTICYVENEVTACGVLAKNMADGGLDDAPIWTDLRTFDGAAWRGVVDLVIGGYPCQPFSNAGRRLGVDDPRHLWPAVAGIVAAVEPRWCFFENVGAHLRLGFREVARDLHAMGYRVAAGLFTAEEVGAPHRRERLFILADRGCGAGRASAERSGEGARTEGADWAGERSGDVADRDQQHDDWSWNERERRRIDANEPRPQGRREPERRRGDELPAWPPGPTDDAGWRRVLAVRPDLAPAVEPEVRGVAHGMAGGLARSDQLHILGNGVVPAQAAYALRVLADALA